jgi:hypothetical protein
MRTDQRQGDNPTSTGCHTRLPSPDFGAIPEEQKTYLSWVVWRYERRNGKLTRVLYDPRTGRPASATDSRIWGRFEEAKAVLELYFKSSEKVAAGLRESREANLGMDSLCGGYPTPLPARTRHGKRPILFDNEDR